MFKRNGLAFKIGMVALGSWCLTACSGGTAVSSFGAASTSVNAGPDGDSNGIADPTLFFVGVNSDKNDIAHVHKTGVFGTNCAIDPKGPALQDISCTIDIPEGEIFSRGVSMIYNVPPSMCRYLRRQTYWYYNQEIGIGPKNIVITRRYDDSILSAYTCSVDGSAPSATCSGYTEVDINPTNPTIVCKYDQSAGNGKNGCMGNYSLTVTDRKVTSSPATDNTTTNVSTVPWGGSVGAVLGGAAKYGWATSSAGVPLTIQTDARSGLLNVEYAIPAPLDNISTATTVEIANNFTPAFHTHTGFGPVLTPAIPTRTSSLPYFIDPIDDRTGDVISPGHSTYEFECLDQAFEVLHRVKVSVREWDVYQDYVNYVQSKGVTEIFSRSGVEGSPSCAGLGTACNDLFDADDFVNLILGGPYNMSLGAIPNRGSYFPNVQPK